MMKATVLLAAAVALVLPACTSYQAQSGVIGGLVGAGLGAAFGDDHQDVVAGAAAGTAVGVGAAALHEQNVRQRNCSRYGIPPERQGPAGPPTYEQVPERAADPQPAEPSYPAAERTDNPNQVISPYPPYRKIDITGFRSGQLAKDPKSGEIFMVP